MKQAPNRMRLTGRENQKWAVVTLCYGPSYCQTVNKLSLAVESGFLPSLSFKKSVQASCCREPEDGHIPNEEHGDVLDLLPRPLLLAATR